MIALETKKKVIYLDQLFISNLAKAADRNLEGYQKLFSLLEQAVAEEKVVCPSSWFHGEEASLLVAEVEKKIHYQFGYLGQTDYKHSEDIELNEFYWAALQYLGRPASPKWGDIFTDNPDARLKPFKISARTSYKALDIPGHRKRWQQAMEKVRLDILRNPRVYRQQLELEKEAAIQGFGEKYWTQMAGVFGHDLKAYQVFLKSNFLEHVPCQTIQTKMWSSILTGSTSRAIEEGDFVDVTVIGAYLPYAHIFTSDTFMAHHIRQLSIDANYKTKIFSGSSGDIENFCAEVERIICDTAPANAPFLTVVLLATDAIKADYWNVCQKLASSCRYYENIKKGGWVELLNVDDGGCPQGPGQLNIPFFMEFDDSITAGENLAGTKQKALARARSNKVLFFDRHHITDHDFIGLVVEELGKGNSQPLGFTVMEKPSTADSAII